jgi:peptide-methionine (S)-S-oxide reductase
MIEGVIRTRVGYAGGQKSDPDYGNIGDHTETLQIDFDPLQITYTDLLDIFWRSHTPTGQGWGRQYMNAVFHQNEEQQQLAMKSKSAMEKKLGRKVHTEVLPLYTFYRAEDYHQKHFLRRRNDLMKEYDEIYSNYRDFVDSTAVARLNGYVGGHGSAEQLSREIESLGLSTNGQKALVNLVRMDRDF